MERIYYYNGKAKPERDNSTLKAEKKARYYYHLTDKGKWGNKIWLYPICGNEGNRSFEEPRNARICVSHSIANCMSAIAYCGPQTYFVYRTEQKVCAYWPYGIEDAVVTRERWLIDATPFVFVATLNTEPFIEANMVPTDNEGCGSTEYLATQRKVRNQWIAALRNPPVGAFELEQEWFNFEK